MVVLVTGGAGYIGSHTVKMLKEKGLAMVVYDNLSSGHREAVNGVPFVEGDIRDKGLLGDTLKSYGVTEVIHFAALSLVGESMTKPDKYYHNNVFGTMCLLNMMLENNVQRIVFSSSAAVYGEAGKVPIMEGCSANPTNVYGRTKKVVENILADYEKAYGLKYVSLRYFNACGADESGKIGEDHDPETHLIPLVLQAALGRKKVSIYGDDYPTRDGTCIRDFIHVNDLASAHLLAMEQLRVGKKSDVFNLGNENGFSVNEIITAAEKITGKAIPAQTVARRLGDPAVLVAGSEKARSVLGWKPEYTDLKQMIGTAWKWHSKNQDGFTGEQ